MSAGESPMAGGPAAGFAREGAAASVGARRLRLRGRLNLFQAAMLRWRDLHPYNAVHVVRVRKPFEPGRLEAVIAERLLASGLTGLAIDRKHRRYEYRGGPATVDLDIVAGEGDGEALFDCRDALGRNLGSLGRRQGKVAGSFIHLIDRQA